jgi:hypothetical protein
VEANFCDNLRSRALRLPKLRRLSVILDVNLDEIEETAITFVFDWIKAVTTSTTLEEFHLSLTRHNIGVEDWSDSIEEVIMPLLLDLEAYFTSHRHFKQTPRVRISIGDASEECLEYVRSRLVRFENGGFVDATGTLVGSLFFPALLIQSSDHQSITWALQAFFTMTQLPPFMNRREGMVVS